MTIYNSIKQTGRYLLATGALLTALYSCENKSNFDNKSDLTVKYDASLPDLENILSDMLDNQIPSELGNDGSPEEDYVLNRDGSIDIPLDDLYDNPDQIPSGELGTDGSPEEDYVLNKDGSIDIPLDDLYDIPSDSGIDSSPNTDYVLNDQIPTEEINLADLLQEDNSREDTDHCVNNHPPTIYARTEPPSGSTITLDDEMVTYIVDGAEDPDGNLRICWFEAILNDEFYASEGDFSCERFHSNLLLNTGEYTIIFTAEDECGAISEPVISTLYVVEN